MPMSRTSLSRPGWWTGPGDGWGSRSFHHHQGRPANDPLRGVPLRKIGERIAAEKKMQLGVRVQSLQLLERVGGVTRAGAILLDVVDIERGVAGNREFE